jgi:hypothetical protein
LHLYTSRFSLISVGWLHPPTKKISLIYFINYDALPWYVWSYFTISNTSMLNQNSIFDEQKNVGRWKFITWLSKLRLRASMLEIKPSAVASWTIASICYFLLKEHNKCFVLRCHSIRHPAIKLNKQMILFCIHRNMHNFTLSISNRHAQMEEEVLIQLIIIETSTWIYQYVAPY